MFMRSGQLRYRPFPSVPEKRGERQLGSDFGVGWIAFISLTDRPPTTRSPHPLRQNLSPTTAHLPAESVCLIRLRIRARLLNKVRCACWKWRCRLRPHHPICCFSRIAILLFILVAGLLTVFGYYASSICITVVLAGFLAILFDPVVVTLEKLHLPRGVAAAGIVLAGMSLIGLLGYALYGRAMSFAEELPVYASKVQQTIEPISRKIQNFQQSAGNLTNDVHPTKKVPEVRLQESPTWPDYLVRGVGSVWGVLIIAGVVPFLTFFMLCTKDQMATRMDGLFDSRIDAARFIRT